VLRLMGMHATTNESSKKRWQHHGSTAVGDGLTFTDTAFAMETSGVQARIASLLATRRTTHMFPFGVSFLNSSVNPHLVAMSVIELMILNPRLPSFAWIHLLSNLIGGQLDMLRVRASSPASGRSNHNHYSILHRPLICIRLNHL
jgi:hypothetical protein